MSTLASNSTQVVKMFPPIRPLLVVLLLAGCQSVAIDPEIRQLAPDSLGASAAETSIAAPSGWLQTFADPQLNQWVGQAINDNFSLQEARARVEAARQQRRITAASLWPQLDLGLDGQRRKAEDVTPVNSFDVSLDISWELDLWGKLDDSRDASDYRLMSEQAQFQATRISLAAQVARRWYDLVAQRQLSELFRQRVHNLQTNLDIIRSGYRQGINSALDVYLARSDLATENSNLSAQLERQKEAVRQLQLLLGQHPSGSLTSADSSELPELPGLDAENLNSQLVRNRYDVQASYLTLLAGDRELARAHKDRFPSVRLTGSTGDSSDEFDQLLDGGSLAWSLLGGLTQPLFAGGRLQARQYQAKAELEQQEQRYLQTLFDAFAEVERGLTNEVALRQQLEQLFAARKHAEAAEELAFEQYRQGLQEYTSVLEAQRRAFSAQNNVIGLRNQLLQNRINLYLALGGDY
ncbi:TolC family protein [Pseudomaricurvus alkylphenolicus]|uniref:efflux transporter outer membrane subunit n=1 Tax=Pseudomaricurvus alkylphenolicus TaxID=1306991 RepID=UPI0014200627|nr:TolC family protein [Pseudomaricurvus alkylphenolicus]NIB39701.1 TolC family protein [Pseudomaricurvus alkylphenolicus]